MLRKDFVDFGIELTDRERIEFQKESRIYVTKKFKEYQKRLDPQAE